MRFASLQWIGAASVAILLHGSLLMTWSSTPDGNPSRPPGPAVQMATSMGGILGQAVELEADPAPVSEAATVAPEDDLPDTPVTELLPATDEPAQPVASTQTRIAATAPIDPVEELPRARADLPDVETRDAIPPPLQKPTPPQRRKTRQTREQTQKRSKAPRSKKRNARQKKQAGKRGTRSKGRAGRQRKSGGRGRGKASPGAIASFKSRVRGRIAGCTRRTLSGRGSGRVVIRFRVNSGGRASSVRVSGSGSLRSAAASAARGCSFPRPPRGAGSLSFTVPVTIR